MNEHPWTPENPGAWVDPNEEPTAADLQEPPCTCGDPEAEGVVHRLDGPCYLAEDEESPLAEPHTFKALRLFDLRRGGRCRECLLPMHAHPVHYHAPARAPGDMSKAEVTWRTLHG